MAAADSIIADVDTLIPIAIIADIVRKTCTKYTWNKRDSTYKSFLKHLANFADEKEISLENLATSSCTHAINYIYPSTVKFDWLKVPELNERFQNIPYIIHVGEDNITTVVIRSGNVDCPLKEISPDMMQMLRYLGIVRVYAIGELSIPYWTDNIVDLQINEFHVMHYLDAHRIPFPKYLQRMVDQSNFEGMYTNWLPPTLTTLVSACLELRNLSPNLKNYTYTGTHNNVVLANAEYLPIGLDKVIYTNTLNSVNISEIAMPPGTQYLELKLSRIYNRVLMFKNVKTLYIAKFSIFATLIDNEDILASNLTLDYESHCCIGCNRYLQNVDIILEEGLNHLIINLTMNSSYILYSSIEFLKCIKQVPASLKYLSIYILKTEFSSEPIYPAKKLLIKEYKNLRGFMNWLSPIKDDYDMLLTYDTILQDFMQRFSHIKVYI